MLSNTLPQIVTYTGTRADWCSGGLCGRKFRVPAVLVDGKPVCPKCTKLKGYVPNTNADIQNQHCDRPKPQTRAPKRHKSPSKARESKRSQPDDKIADIKPKSKKQRDPKPGYIPGTRRKINPKPSGVKFKYLEQFQSLLKDGPRSAQELAQAMGITSAQFQKRVFTLAKKKRLCRMRVEGRALSLYSLPEHREQLEEMARSLAVVKQPSSPRIQRRQQILEFLQDGPRTTHEIAAFTGISHENARIMLFKMRQKKQVISRSSIRGDRPSIWALPSHQALLEAYQEAEPRVADQIMAWIAQHPGKSARQISLAVAALVNNVPETIRRELYGLVQSGQIACIHGKGRGRLHLHYLPDAIPEAATLAVGPDEIQAQILEYVAAHPGLEMEVCAQAIAQSCKRSLKTIRRWIARLGNTGQLTRIFHGDQVFCYPLEAQKAG